MANNVDNRLAIWNAHTDEVCERVCVCVVALKSNKIANGKTHLLPPFSLSTPSGSPYWLRKGEKETAPVQVFHTHI